MCLYGCVLSVCDINDVYGPLSAVECGVVIKTLQKVEEADTADQSGNWWKGNTAAHVIQSSHQLSSVWL